MFTVFLQPLAFLSYVVLLAFAPPASLPRDQPKTTFERRLTTLKVH